MNLFKVPPWLHVVFALVIVVADRVTTLIQSGSITGGGAQTIMSVLALVALVVHSVDAEAVAK